MILSNRKTFKSTYPRQEILKQIHEASSWFCKDLPLEHIQHQISRLKDKLKLEAVIPSSEEIHYFSFTVKTHWFSRAKEHQLLTGRQDTCYISCMNHINEDRPGEAYHELHDFIDDYGRKGEFTSELEIKGIKLMAEAMDSKIKELRNEKNHSQSV